jgi:hypothetical protein
MMNNHLPDFAKLNLSSSHVASHTNSVPIQPTSPPRPKHLSTRSITEISSVPKTHKHHHHPHLHHRDKEEKEKHPKASNSSLNLQPSAAEFGPGREERSRSEGVTPSESRNASRRGSVNGAAAGAAWDDSVGMGVLQREKRVVKEGEVREERERGALRAAYVILSSFLFG